MLSEVQGDALGVLVNNQALHGRTLAEVADPGQRRTRAGRFSTAIWRAGDQESSARPGNQVSISATS